jgi:hypothetical protein
MEYIIVYIIIWCIFGAIAATIYSNKSRSGCWGFIVGFLLGPLGIIYALIIKDNKVIFRCPICKGEIEPDAQVCPHCRTQFKK